MSGTFALMLPGEPVPVRLMNTIWADRRGVHDALVDVYDLRSWLAAVGESPTYPPAGGRLSQADVDAFRALRDALRALAAVVTEDTRAATITGVDVEKAVANVNDAVTAGTTWPQLRLRRGRLEQRSAGTATSAMRSLSAVAAEAIELLTGKDRVRLRACYAPGCVLYFVQKHARREWCSTACGNRERAARHYRRHHA
jgi:predicted RNA-binding Zn ribbon-like protein